MKIVIDLPGEIHKSIFDGVYCGILDDRVYDAIKNGTPLPETIDGLIQELEEKASWNMFDDWGNTTAVHDAVVRIIKEYCGEEQE